MNELNLNSARPQPGKSPLRVSRKPMTLLTSLLCGLVLVACGGGGSDSESQLAVTTGYAPVTASGGVTYTDGTGDGSGGGGDSGGAGVGGNGGAFNNALVTVMRADGTLVGSAVTDVYGMVSVKNNGDTQPLLITLQGSSTATYWDEALQKQVSFPASQTMHAMVAPSGSGQTLSKNVGVTPLTEAAYQYAVASLGGADAWKTAANVIKANEAVRAEFNRFVPSTRAISDITRLASMSRDATTQVFGASSPNNTYGLIVAGLVRASTLHNAGSSAPGIDLVTQIALDLYDAKLDGFGPVFRPVAPSPTQQAYVVATLNADLLQGMQNVAATNGVAQQFTTYGLSGSVAGLVTGGLVLANAGATTAVLPGAGTFSFGAMLVAGATYSISVKTQPDGQVCTVANGSGVAGTADVTTPTVSCTPSTKPLSLGGSVTGLTASGLVLANGGVPLPVTAGAATFSFGPVLVAGSTYSVTVQTQPGGLTCTVANGSGTAGTTDVTTPAVTCAPTPVTTFSLGGSVSGLTASGLELANGGASVTVPANATSFTFGSVLVAGSSYNVTVKTQPAGQTCTVANGSGINVVANVTTPAVSCVVSTYTLGGSVTGLTGSGLVLANGSVNLPVAAGATTFTFGPVLLAGSAYNVTVKTQPTGQSCSVANGSGTTGTADVTAVAITCITTAQTITFVSPGEQTLGTPPFALVATASSGLPVTLTSSTPAVCTVSGTTLTLVAVGTCTVKANQPGNATYAPAPEVTNLFAVVAPGLIPQTITFTSPGPQVAVTSAALVATSNSGLTVSFASTTPSVCTVSGTTLTLVTAGTCSVTASQPGNATYAAAAPVSNSFAVSKAAQTISFASPGPQTVDAPATLAATSTSSLTVAFASSTPSICTVSGTTLTLVSAGTCTVTASQPGDATFAAATPVSHSFTVAAAPVGLVANGGFEVGKTTPPPVDPTKAQGWLGSPSYAGRDCTVSHTGNCSLLLMSPAFNADGAEQNTGKDGSLAPLTSGTKLTLTFWAKGTGGATGNFQARLAYLDGDGAIKYDSSFISFNAQLLATTWQQFTIEGGVVPQAGLAAFIQFYQPIGPIGVGPAGEDWFAGQVYVDDVSLQVRP